MSECNKLLTYITKFFCDLFLWSEKKLKKELKSPENHPRQYNWEELTNYLLFFYLFIFIYLIWCLILNLLFINDKRTNLLDQFKWKILSLYYFEKFGAVGPTKANEMLPHTPIFIQRHTHTHTHARAQIE